MTRAMLALILCSIACAQAPEAGPVFEAAAVKPPTGFGGDGIRIVRNLAGGPGTPSPGLMQCENCTLSSLVAQAYGVDPYRLAGPKALENEYVVQAKVPAGATPAEARLMLQDLLADRFKLKAHWEKRPLQGYELTVAKGGPKLKASSTEPAAEQQNPRITLNKALVPIIPPGYPANGIRTVSNGGVLHCTAGGRATMEQLAQELTKKLGQPVADKTGLTGKYDFNFLWASGEPKYRPGTEPPEDELPPPPFPIALRQLGLDAQPTKVTMDFLVVDHVESVPTAN